jgi:hypothetical protein
LQLLNAALGMTTVEPTGSRNHFSSDDISVGSVPSHLINALAAIRDEVNRQIEAGGYAGSQKPIQGDPKRQMVSTNEISAGKITALLFAPQS